MRCRSILTVALRCYLAGPGGPAFRPVLGREVPFDFCNKLAAILAADISGCSRLLGAERLR
jgi:hypothetical protein